MQRTVQLNQLIHYLPFVASYEQQGDAGDLLYPRPPRLGEVHAILTTLCFIHSRITTCFDTFCSEITSVDKEEEATDKQQLPTPILPQHSGLSEEVCPKIFKFQCQDVLPVCD